MKILGIETSCDETSAGIVEDGHKLLANVVKTQIDIHKEYGGVVPEVAARNHIEVIMPVVNRSMQIAKLNWKEIDGIAVTNGPGLLGSLMIGTLTARILALIHRKPIYPVHHVLGHIYANWLLEEQPEFPVLALIVSGGHTHLFYLESHLKVKLIGKTTDDAVGEAYDKVAKLIGLNYPGGPAIDQAFHKGDPNFLDLPTPKVSGKYDFSFSGLKTAVLRRSQELIEEDFRFPSWQIAERLTEEQINNIAASFQKKAVEILVNTTKRAYEEFNPKSVIIGGGVAANQYLRQELQEALPIKLNYAPIDLCTDNGAMIAALGCFMAEYSKPVNPREIKTEPSLKINYQE
ncbi:MAG: tRNA (adenosine(37)-N6)-threonylcarbamoyltransferase complex transferase subunit TsaD [Candidatus Nomurabacteria bacterium]|nr:MAG: tRNA (adenosine(37)-N6)-threonylcarbamoyltransferase complex transferase subunit TsaD [Candidatus Nomurabacteria bacterium]HRV76268.1 tRNA (adenosine(37)-N6)-threonylcarbamoyltransferase complex transferase subunit TsaD [Candidatus Saccharimonadales bacterium]